MASIVRRTYKKKLPDGTYEVRKYRNFTIEYTDASGRRRRADGSPDRAVAKQRLARIERDLARKEEGLADPHQESKCQPIMQHVKAYREDLKATRRDELYCKTTGGRLETLVRDCHWKTLKDITSRSFMEWRTRASQPLRPGAKRPRGQLGDTLAPCTLNQYLQALRGFLNWCVRTERLPGVSVGRKQVSTLLSGVETVRGIPVRKRRALTDDEVAAVLAVAGNRQLVYRFALATGLRRKELVQLQWGDLVLPTDDEEGSRIGYVQLRAEATKARRGDRLALPTLLVNDLRKSRRHDDKANDPVFLSVPGMKVWKADLEAAGIPYKDAQGRQADFHGGTRKTLCTRMHRARIPLATAMRVMRHTDAKLTLVDYTDEEQLGLAAALLPEIQAAVPTEKPTPKLAAA